MNLTLLFDLDNTLLDNNMADFMPAYLHALSQHMKSLTNPDLLIKTLLKATETMMENTDPQKTLKQAFDEAFYPQLGIDPRRVENVITQFYEEVFPSLRPLTRPMHGAKTVIEKALERGRSIAIATNPLFPRTAILQRLEWADLSANQYPFKLIPSYETFHFAKPKPAFFAELLANMGWPEGPVVMVGDDYVNDITSAQAVGINVYWVDTAYVTLNEKTNVPRGDLDGFSGWLDAQSFDQSDIVISTPQAALAILASTPAALSNLVNFSDPTVLHKQLNEEEWCPTEVLCHMRDVESEVNIPRIIQVIKEHNPFIPGKDTDPWAKEREYFQQDGKQALTEFTISRKSLLDLLSNLTFDDWDRIARHAILGPITLFELVKIITVHDRLHIRQIHKILNS